MPDTDNHNEEPPASGRASASGDRAPVTPRVAEGRLHALRAQAQAGAAAPRQRAAREGSRRAVRHRPADAASRAAAPAGRPRAAEDGQPTRRLPDADARTRALPDADRLPRPAAGQRGKERPRGDQGAGGPRDSRRPAPAPGAATPQGAHPPEAARVARGQRRPRQNPITRLVNQWFDRVMGAISDGGLSGQEEHYAAHRTTRDFVWNTVGVGAWGMVFPLLTMIATQLMGVEQAGMLSMAFVTGSLLMILANFGVRTYQISDVEEAHSFADYQVNRWITCVIMVLVGVAYCYVRGYETEMFYISVGIYLYRMVDGLADVYEGRLQQVDKLYLAGVSQAIRSVLALAVFAVTLLVTRNMVAAAFAMAIAAAATFVTVTYPLALLETPKSRKARPASVLALFKNTAPLFLALFLYAVIDNMPKFVMEGALSYDNQLYFNALYFPAQGILITAQLVYKPLLVRMAEVWQDAGKRRQFDLILLGILLVIVAITAANVAVMAWIGIPVMGFLYGIDFEQFRGLMFIMLAAGGVTAAIDFLYQTITVMRRQKDVTTLYLVTFGFSLFVPILLVTFTGLPGAVISYLIVMSILFVLLVWEYFRIRADLARHPQAPAGAAVPPQAAAGTGAGMGAAAADSVAIEPPAHDDKE